MKIALVTPYDYPYPGGVTNHISHLETEFSRLGHDVTILAPSSLDEGTLARGRIVKLGSVVAVPANGSIARITLSLRISGRVKRLLRAEQFDIIHLHEPFVPALPITVLRHSQTINIATFHSSWDGREARLYGNPLLRRFNRRLHGRIAVSEHARDFVRGPFPGDYRVIPNGIIAEEFGDDVAPLPALADGKRNILFVGRLEHRKGFRYLLRAFAAIRAERSDVRLVVVGAYSDAARKRYEAFTRATGILDVLFTGRVADDQIPRYYHSCDVFCAPSTGGESQGIVLLEAMASGRAIVATDIGGYRGVVDSGVEGFLVPPKDGDALAGALRRLLDDPDLRARMGQAGRAKAPRYSWPTIAGQVLAYYEETRRGLPRPAGDDGRRGRRLLGRYARKLAELFRTP